MLEIVIALVLMRGLAMGVTGLALGLGGAAALTKYLQKMLFGVTALDPITFIAISGLFIAVILVASYIPARQATKIDPLVALRHE